MYEKTKEDTFVGKTFTGIQDIFGSTPFQNILYRNSIKNNQESITTANNNGELESDKGIIKEPDSRRLHLFEYVTKENYHGLNRIQLSRNSIIRSTSTIFCDLDDIAKRHSFHCITEVYRPSNADILEAMKLTTCTGFQGKADAIVQECHQSIQPTFLPKDSMQFNTKKIKKMKPPHNDVLSSEILLRDRELGRRTRNNLYYNTDTKHNQKYWSYSKYQTEYTKPMAVKKYKKKDKGKRIDDPCPCQLFSYACPCTDEKSLTELAKNSKCSAATAVDKITSAADIVENTKKKKNNIPKENKGTGVTKMELDAIIHANVVLKEDDPSHTETLSHDSNKYCRSKKRHRLICPKCKENIETVSLTEDDSITKGDSRDASKELVSTAAYNCSTSSRSNKMKSGDGDACLHEPRCELIPVCQILPSDDVACDDQKYAKKKTVKTVPRVIRITKACRHHPPCTVVPSCQRTNVLRNNCEFIPPCLHRPRCVNLPLCVPLPKNINYDELKGNHVSDDEDITECQHIPRCKLVALCQEALVKNEEQHYNLSSQVTNACQNKTFNTSTYIASPKTTFSPIFRSPARISAAESPYGSSNSDKSCQYNCPQMQLNSFDTHDSTDIKNGIIYIRDVGCQFNNKQYSPNDSLAQYKTSSASFDYADIKSDKYYTNVLHTLRYEDKCNSTMGQDPLSTDSVLSAEIDSNCPSHGRRYKTQQCNGFRPKSAYVTAYADMGLVSSAVLNTIKTDVTKRRDTYTVKSRRSFLKGRCRLFAKKNKMSNNFFNISKKEPAN